MRVKMESKKGKSAVCWIYQYSKKSLWLVILLALISGAIADFFDCMSDLAAGSFEYFEQ